jgi:hypothetical protein
MRRTAAAIAVSIGLAMVVGGASASATLTPSGRVASSDGRTLRHGAGPSPLAAAIIPVKSSKAYEAYPQSVTIAGHHYFWWTQSPLADRWTYKGWSVFQTVDGGGKTLLSRFGSLSFSDGVDESNGTLYFQQALRKAPRDANLYEVPLGGSRSALPPAVNDRFWDCCADGYGNWILYDRNRFRSNSSPWKLLVYDRGGGVVTTLATETYRCGCLAASNVVGSLAAYWERSAIHIENLDTMTQVASTLPPTGYHDVEGFLLDPDPTTGGDETLYFVRQASGCGNSVEIDKAPLSDLTQVTEIASFRSGAVITSLMVDDSTGTPDLYFGRTGCRSHVGDIWEIPDA